MNIVLNKPEAERNRRNMGEEPGKLFIGAINSQVKKEEFRAFCEKFGEVSDIVLMEDLGNNRNRGFGFVTFKDPACATKLLQTGPHKLNGREIDPKPSVQRGQLPPSNKGLPNKSLDKKVFVGGISQSTNEEGLKNFFNSSNLPVKDVILMHDNQTLKSRGFGFVTFVDDAIVERVCRQRFFNIDNKTVECKKAEPRGGKNDMGGGQGGVPGGPGGPGGNYNQMQRGGPGGGPNMGGGFNQGWNQNPNPGYGNNQYNQGGGNYGPQGGWGGPPQQGPMGNYGQQPQQQQQQQGYGPRGGQMPNQGGFGNQYNNGNAGYNQQRPQPQQGGYGGGYGQQQQQPPPPQQQPQQQPPPQQQQQQQGSYGQPNASGDGLQAKSPRFDKSLGPPQNYNYGNYGQQQPRQQQQQPEPYSNQAPPQTNQGYNTGNYGGQGRGNYAPNGSMGNYPQEASGYGPQRVNYSAPAQGNFNQPQGGGYGGDMSGGYTAPAPQQQQQQQQPQNYPPQQDSSHDMYGGAPAVAGNFARGGNNAALPFHPYRR